MNPPPLFHSEAGGLEYGHWLILGRVRYPHAQIEITPETIRVHCDRLFLNWDFTFRKGEIAGLRKREWFIWTGIQVEHGVAGAYRRVVFWPEDYAGLRNALGSLGYGVRE